ncbi:MAG: RemK protein [Bacteroidetes bacterium]|nr:RemK protein [Bacteroidota bacterium]
MKSPSNWAHIRDILILPGIVCIVIPFALYQIHSKPFPDSDVLKYLGATIFAIGLIVWAIPVYLFWKMAGGTLAPWVPTQKLVIYGPFRYTRNPMITGVLFILLGEALCLNATGVLIWTIWFFFMNTMYFIFKEEPSMTRRFGDDYLKYKANVPRWLPRFTPYRG